METVPAHGTDIEYRQVDRDEYEATRAAQSAAATADRPAELPVERPDEPDGQHLADTIAEVETEQESPARNYPDGAIAVVLEGRDGRRGVVHIIDPQQWPSSANSALHIGDYETWADGCLALDDYEQVWTDLDPSMGQVAAMFTAWRELTGQDAGKSLRSPGSLRRAARKSR